MRVPVIAVTFTAPPASAASAACLYAHNEVNGMNEAAGAVANVADAAMMQAKQAKACAPRHLDMGAAERDAA